MILRVGEKTTLAKASSNFASLRTVVPMSIVKQWQLKEGDRLDWSWEARNGEIVIVVKKAEHNDSEGIRFDIQRNGKRKKVTKGK
jgi:bifunctional DNA-binding transcriptional regulator/antitoxin component of YhaV-PrlF toxin-antitoxin module